MKLYDATSIINLSTITAYIILCGFLGFQRHIKIKNIRSYTLGDKNISTTVLTATIFATAMGAGSCIGAISKIYTKGILYCVPMLFAFVYCIAMSKIFSIDMSKFSKFISLSEIMTFLYGKSAGYISSVAIVVNAIGLISLQITAIGHVVNYFSHFDYSIGVIGGALIIIIYSIYGGFKAVALTDLFQCVLYFIAFPIACGFMYRDIVGQKNLLDIILASSSGIITYSDIWFTLGSLFYLAFPSISAPYLQRALAARNSSQIVTAFRYASLVWILYSIIIILIGLMLRASETVVVSEQSLYHVIDRYVPQWMHGLIVASIFAVTMSTADSWLNISGTVIAHDILKKFIKFSEGRIEVTIARVSTICILAISALFSIYNQELLEKLWLTRNFWHPVIAVPLLAGILGFKAKQRSFLFGVVFGVIFTVLGKVFTSEFGVVSLLMGTCANAMFFFGSYYYDKLGIDFICSAFNFLKKCVKAWFFNSLSSVMLANIDIKARFAELSIFFIATNIFVFIFYPMSGAPVFDALNYLRLVLMAVDLVVVFYMNNFSKTVLIIIAYLIFMYCLPFSAFSIILLYGHSLVNVVNLILSCLSFYIFTNIVSSILFCTIAFYLSYMYFDLYTASSSVTRFNDPGLGIYLCAINVMLIVFFVFKKYRETKLAAQYTSAIGTGMAHDLRNPLSLIRNYVSALKANVPQKSKLFPNIQHIESAIEDSAQMIDGFLLRIKNGRDVVQTEEKYSVKEVVTEVVHLPMFKLYQTDSVYIRCKEDFYLSVDEFLLKQVLINLLNNAVEARTSLRRLGIHITIGKLKNVGYIKLKDNGCGIEKCYIKKIFEPTFTTKSYGHGMGLAFCKYTLNKIGANISCKSRLGIFTEFLITFNSELL